MRTLRRRAIEVLRSEWEKRGGSELRSADVHRCLTDEGWEVPDYELRELWEILKDERQIKGPPPATDGDAVRLHGNRRITWVNPDILEETLGAKAALASSPQVRIVRAVGEQGTTLVAAGEKGLLAGLGPRNSTGSRCLLIVDLVHVLHLEEVVARAQSAELGGAPLVGPV